MHDNTQEKINFNSSNIILLLWKNKVPILVITILAAISSIIFSSPFFVQPKFKSQVVLFPSSTNSISKALLGENPAMKQDLLQFGEEEDAEQLLQVLNSSKIRDRIIQKYDLKKHYDIDTLSKYPQTLMFKEYESNIKYRRTENMAVEITVMDIDPDTAALIANDVAALLDSVKIKMQKERAGKGFQIVEAEYKNLQSEIKTAEDSLDKLREFGVNDYETQAEMLNMQLAKEIAKSANSPAVRALNDKIAILAKYGGPYVSLRDALEHDKKKLSELKAKYDEAKIDATEELPQTFIVDRAYPAEKKSYPIRWLIVVVSTMGAFLTSAFSVILLAGLKAAFKNS